MLPAPLFFLEASADRIAQDLALLALLLIPAIPSGNLKVHVVNKDKTTIDCTPNLHYFFSWWAIRQITFDQSRAEVIKTRVYTHKNLI